MQERNERVTDFNLDEDEFRWKQNFQVYIDKCKKIKSEARYVRKYVDVRKILA